MALIRRYESQIYGNYKSAILKYGLYSGIGLSFVVLFRYWIIMPLSQPVSYAENIALLVFMFASVFIYKKKLPQGKLMFKEGFVLGLGLGVVASIIYGIFLYVYSFGIDPEFQNRCFDIQRALPNNQHLADDAIRQMTRHSSIAFSGILLSSIMSILWAMIVSILLRNERAVVKNSKLK
ncbi:MAG: DUF4199 domain-containing protein [Bacteroidales bacterium]